MCDADESFPVQDKSAIGAFPTKDQLFAFDAIILGDVDPKHKKLGDQNLRHLRDFVRVSSEFYPQLGAHYAARIGAWFDANYPASAEAHESD